MYNIHSGTTPCLLCPKTFKNISTHSRHMQDVHRKWEKEPICSHCGNAFSYKRHLKKHEAKFHRESRINSFFYLPIVFALFVKKSNRANIEEKTWTECTKDKWLDKNSLDIYLKKKFIVKNLRALCVNAVLKSLLANKT